jgi:hypothetical protein
MERASTMNAILHENRSHYYYGVTFLRFGQGSS